MSNLSEMFAPTSLLILEEKDRRPLPPGAIQPKIRLRLGRPSPFVEYLHGGLIRMQDIMLEQVLVQPLVERAQPPIGSQEQARCRAIRTAAPGGRGASPRQTSGSSHGRRPRAKPDFLESRRPASARGQSRPRPLLAHSDGAGKYRTVSSPKRLNGVLSGSSLRSLVEGRAAPRGLARPALVEPPDRQPYRRPHRSPRGQFLS